MQGANSIARVWDEKYRHFSCSKTMCEARVLSCFVRICRDGFDRESTREVTTHTLSSSSHYGWSHSHTEEMPTYSREKEQLSRRTAITQQA